jgi:hypothetical protein
LPVDPGGKSRLFGIVDQDGTAQAWHSETDITIEIPEGQIMTYAIGAEVVYIGPDYRDHPIILAIGLTVPTTGAIYHIRAGRSHPRDRLAYLLNEYSNPEAFIPEFGEVAEQVWIPHKWLNPLEKRATAISTLLALQNPANHKHMDTVE